MLSNFDIYCHNLKIALTELTKDQFSKDPFSKDQFSGDIITNIIH